MDRQLLITYLGMKARMRSLETVANNLANASTTGFKAEIDYQQSLEEGDPVLGQGQPTQPKFTVSEGAPGVFGVLSGTAMKTLPGALRETGRLLDVALEGSGYLVIQTPRGRRYTRAGNFTLNRERQLVTQDGSLVVGEQGAITIPVGEVSIGTDGTLSVAGKNIGRLKIVRFANPGTELVKEGGTFFTTVESAQPLEDRQTQVRQGMLEMSNVDPMQELVTLIQLQREFESLQRGMKLKLAGEDEIGKI